jgi:ketosteroid isomerase-like protein
MKSILSSLPFPVLALTFTLALSHAGSAQPASPPFDADAEVARWVRLWNTYDLDVVDQLFLQDDRVTYFSSEKEGLIRGIEAVREHHRGFGFVPGGKTPTSELWLADVSSDDFGDTAVVTAIWFFGHRNQPQNQHGPMTAVYVRTKDGFRLAHLNFSHY